MRSGRVLSFVAAALFANVVGGCAGVKQKPTRTRTAAAAAAARARRRHRRAARHRRHRSVNHDDVRQRDRWTTSEQCDDGNKTAGDGCSAICQIPAGWSCTRLAQRLHDGGVCGDGILGASEACDDGNTAAGDGCSADCKTRRDRLRVPRARAQAAFPPAATA